MIFGVNFYYPAIGSSAQAESRTVNYNNGPFRFLSQVVQSGCIDVFATATLVLSVEIKGGCDENASSPGDVFCV